ncbi:MAG TPA: retropepsin-like aspartic protease [Methylomirabilota bacterium]|nr:retropepsin-like aspartic protease [Methylomirabilota bacterium]
MRSVLALVLVLATAAPAAAALYRWTATDGTTHYTSDLESIPEASRAGAVEIGHPAARPAPPPPLPPPPGAVVPFVRGAAVVVEASLNGIPLRLLLDTGADRTVIAPAALARAGLPWTGAPVRITGVTGSAVATLVSVPRLDLAGVHVGPLSVIAHAVPGEALDGLLGRDVLDAFTVTFDAAAGHVTLMPR